MLLTVIEKKSLERYLENFNDIYQEYDRLIQHEVNFGKLFLLKSFCFLTS